MKAKNQAAVALGRMARGVPKTLTPAERERRSRQARSAQRKLAAILKAGGPAARRIIAARKAGQERARAARQGKGKRKNYGGDTPL